MDIFVPNLKTTSPSEQSRLMGNRDPQSAAKLWLRQKPLHGLALAGRVNAGQLAARMARLDKTPLVGSRDMFPFRIFQSPSLLQSNPAWQDGYGTANWRSFQVWTGTAQAYMLMTGATNAPSGSLMGVPTAVYVARTCGHNQAGQMAANAATVANTAIVGESWNEYMSAMNVGLYPANPNNGPSNTGPANYPNPYNEIIFTAPPSSIAVFWISWDTNTIQAGAPIYSLALNSQLYASFPVLHFGGLTANADYIAANGTGYFGDLNSTNGTAILGALPDTGFYDEGTPPQLYSYFPSNVFAAPYNGGSQTPEGTVIVGSIVVGASGAAADTGNDGQVQIFQELSDNLHYPMQRLQWRGTYNSSNFYFPNEMVVENSASFIQVTPLALQGVDPQNGMSNAPLANGTNYITFQNLWMPLGGSAGIGAMLNVVSEHNNYVSCTYVANGSNVNCAKPPNMRGFIANTSLTTNVNTGNVVDKQSIFPPYSAGTILFGIVPSGGTGVNGVTLEDVTPGRFLGTQFQTCENVGGTPTAEYRLFAAGTPYTNSL